jgi:eukaryotic-like serine/threonine-protein kinase
LAEYRTRGISHQSEGGFFHKGRPLVLLAQLGVGGMGEVYLAEDTRLGRKIALKVLPSHFTTDEERVHRFQREARAASALNHPNILTIYEIGQTDASHFIATEFIEGETLRQHMTTTRITVSETLDLAMQVASALCQQWRRSERGFATGHSFD